MATNEILYLDLLDSDELTLDLGNEGELELVIGEAVISYPVYEGDYEVIPRLNEDQILATRNKRMLDNVTVKPIPVTTTQNPYNGKTVVIG